MSCHDYIINGPNLHKPIPEESLGIQIYNSLINNEHSKELLVDAITGKSTTIKQLLKYTCKLSQALINAGCKIGDVITISSENNLYFFQPVIAALYQGICLAPINQNYSKHELVHSLNISRPKIVFCSNKAAIKFINIRELTPYIERIIVFDLNLQIKGVEDYIKFIKNNCNKSFDVNYFRPVNLLDTRNHLAGIFLSSGTTGLPKGVMITHRNISNRLIHTNDGRYYRNEPNSIYLALLPFFHSFGFMTSLDTIIKSQKIVILNGFQEELFLQTIERYRITNLWLVPPLVVFLAKTPLIKNYDLSSIKVIGCGAAPLGRDVEEKVNEMFKLDRIMQGYGLTETTLGVLFMPIGEGRFGSSGKIAPGMSVKVRDPQTGQSLGPNKIGELCFKGDLIMKGYYKNEAATKNTFNNDWLLTGDLGYYDEDGFFFIVDRLKELIKYKGFQVPPAELEAILLSNTKIKDAAVVGLPDEEVGELAVAAVVKQSNVKLTEEEVKTYVANRISKHKHLHGGVRFVEEIPKNASGKTLRRVLRESIIKNQSKL